MKYRSLSFPRRDVPFLAEPPSSSAAESWHDSSFLLQQGLEVREITPREWRQLLAEPPAAADPKRQTS